MLDLVCSTLSALLFVLTTLTPHQDGTRQAANGREEIRECPASRQQSARDATTGARPFARTELYFGAAMPHGVVTEAQFQEFIDGHVTPFFPDGLTILKAEGRFRGADGGAIREPSFVVVLLYPSGAMADTSRRIERIRTLYRNQFDQLSVLRVDDARGVCVSY